MATPSPAARLLRDYVAIPSVNPMARTDIDPAISGERRYAEHVQAQLRRLGVDAELVGQGERISVIGRLEVPDAIDEVMIASHLDTVPVDGMVIPPFDPVIDDGRLYGRGSCDTKAGMAALLAALEQVLKHGRLRRNLVLVGEADEEMGSAGVQDVLGWLGAGRRVGWALATEPTGMRLVTHHKGRTALRIAAHGRACHSSHPERGENAIVLLARATLALEELQHALSTRSDALLGSGTLTVTMIGGGHAPNAVPDRAFLVADRRTLPGDSLERITAEIEAALDRAGLAEKVTIEDAQEGKDALGTPADSAAVRACQQALAAAGLPTANVSVQFATDAGPLSAHGIPSVVLGPGDIAQAHTADEFVPLSQVDAMQGFFERLLTAG